MNEPIAFTVSAKERSSLAVKPDVAFVKLHVVGDGMLMQDAVASAKQKAAEITDALRKTNSPIDRIDVFDVYSGQKEERLRSDPSAYPRPQFVLGILVSTSPDDLDALHKMVDEGIKRGALLENPHQRSYLMTGLDSALLFGLASSGPHENQVIMQCLDCVRARCKAIAEGLGRKIGRLLKVSDAVIEPAGGEPFGREFAHIERTFPTRYLSPSPDKVVLRVTLGATYELVEG